MRIGMRLLLGYFLIVAVAAWFVLSIFVQEIKPGVRRATEGTLIDTATLICSLAIRLMASWPGRLSVCITIRFAPISAVLAKCVTNTMSI